MSRHFAILSVLALSLTLPTWAGKTYTRDEAVKIALENSPDVKTAEEAVVSANSQVDGGYGNAYPSVDLSAKITRIFGLDDVKSSSIFSDAASTMSLVDDKNGHPSANAYDTDVIGPALDGLMNNMAKQGYRWQSTVDLTVTQILYAAGQVGTGIDIAKAYKRLSEVSLENTKSTVRYAVDNSFDQLIYLDSAVAIYEASIAQTQDHINYVKQAFESGLVGELDMIRAQLQLDELQSGLENMKKSQILARNALLNTMGMEYDAEVQFQGDLRNPDNGVAYPDTSMANVKKRRKELAILNETETMMEKKIDISSAGYKPTIAIGGMLEYANKQNEFYKWDAPDWDKNINKAIFLSFSMNLFNGMKTRESVTQAKSDLRTTQIQKETAERGFRLQIESCANTLSDAESQLTLKKRSVELAQKNLDLTEAAYKVGRETQLNYLDATMSLRQAKLNYMQAVLNWNSAYNALLQATGEY